MDPRKMTREEKHDYIFAQDPNRRNEVRFEWISHCLLGDIRTFLDGVDSYLQKKRDKENFSDNLPRGGSNLSVPILVSTALEFVSGLCVGKTSYKDSNMYNATENVKSFIIRFFPDSYYKKLPLLLWDGIRNGIVHTFSPKPFEYQKNYIRFQFFCDDPKAPSDAIRDKNAILMRINIFELYEVLRKSIEDYCAELRINEDLQDKFILAWSSIEKYTRNIDGDQDKRMEADILISGLKKSSRIIFS